MTLDKIVDAYLAVTAMIDEPGCPVFTDRIDVLTYCNPPAMLLKHLDETIRKCAGPRQPLTHRGQPLAFDASRRRWRLEDSPIVAETTHIEVKERG